MGSFFKILDRVRRLRVMARPRRQLAIAHGPQLSAHRLDRNDDAIFLERPLAEIDKPPAHDAVYGRDRAVLHHARQRCAMLPCQPRRLPRRLASDEPGRAMGVELQNPVPDNLKRHAADLRRLPPRRPVVNRRQRQKSTGLAPVLGLLGLAAKLSCVKIVSKRDRHRELHGSRHRIKSFPIRESLLSLDQWELV